MSAAYFTAAIPEPFRILGLALKPLSLGRYRLMKRFEVAFVAEEEAKAEGGDLILGLLICSMRCDEFLQWVASKSSRREVSVWGRRVSRWPWIGRLPWVGRWWRQRFSFDLLEKVRLFKAYLETGAVIPNHVDLSGDDASSSCAHWSQAIEVALRSELGWTAEEINEHPLSKAFADYFKWAENKGIVRLISDEDMERGKLNARIFEEALGKEGRG